MYCITKYYHICIYTISYLISYLILYLISYIYNIIWNIIYNIIYIYNHLEYNIIIYLMIFITATTTTTTTTSITVNIHIWLCIYIYILWKWHPEYKSKHCADPVGALRPAANAQQPCKEEKTPDSELPGGKIMGIYWEDINFNGSMKKPFNYNWWESILYIYI